MISEPQDLDIPWYNVKRYTKLGRMTFHFFIHLPKPAAARYYCRCHRHGCELNAQKSLCLEQRAHLSASLKQSCTWVTYTFFLSWKLWPQPFVVAMMTSLAHFAFITAVFSPFFCNLSLHSSHYKMSYNCLYFFAIINKMCFAIY